MSKQTEIYRIGNMTIKGSDLITMVQKTTKTTSKGKPKVMRLSSQKMSDIIRESKRMIFENSSLVATAKKQTSMMFKPEIKIIIKNNSKTLNHLHAEKVRVFAI